MNYFKDAFEAGPREWLEHTKTLKSISLCRTVLKSANHKDVEFYSVDFSGSTLQDCYFTNCQFINCTFTESAFENVTFLGVVFEACSYNSTFFRDCELSFVSIEETTGLQLRIKKSNLVSCRLKNVQLKSLEFALCSELECRVSTSLIESIALQNCSLNSLTIDDPGLTTISLLNSDGTMSVEKATICSLNVTSCSNLSFILRDVVVKSIEAADLTGERIRIDAIQAMIFNSDLDIVDLKKSTFVSSSIVGCEWPNSEGNISWSGKFNIPENLIVQPIGDISGISESTRRIILRAQILASWEEASKFSRFTWLLHRTIGISTAHGKSPQRLIMIAYSIALFEALVGQILAHWEWIQARFINPQTLSIGEAIDIWTNAIFKAIPATFIDSLGYLSIIVSFKNLFSLRLHPFLIGASTVVGIILIGILINLLANRISMRG